LRGRLAVRSFWAISIRPCETCRRADRRRPLGEHFHG